MHDHLAGADSDSGLTLALDCPACGGKHRVALSRLDGRFAFDCGGTTMLGQVDNWADFKHHAAAGAADRQKKKQETKP